MNDLFALLSGDKCNSTFSVPFVFFAARSSSRRATWDGASRMSLGSFVLGVCLVKVLMFTQFLACPSSLFSCVCQVSPVECHALCPDCVNVLLTYTHSYLSFSVV
jgi:hypothetical protein